MSIKITLPKTPLIEPVRKTHQTYLYAPKDQTLASIAWAHFIRYAMAKRNGQVRFENWLTKVAWDIAFVTGPFKIAKTDQKFAREALSIPGVECFQEHLHILQQMAGGAK
jgi:hypothetical protein